MRVCRIAPSKAIRRLVHRRALAAPLLAVLLWFTAMSAFAQGPRGRRPLPPVEEPPPAVNNAGKLLAETPLVRVHLGKSGGGRPLCTPQFADVVLIFKVDEEYRITGNEGYWRIVDETIVPAVIAECGGAKRITIENYVAGYRLAPVGAGASRVFGPNDRFMTKREQNPGFPTMGDGDAVELPLTRAIRSIGTPGLPERTFPTFSERNSTLPAATSIVEARAEAGDYIKAAAANIAAREAAKKAAAEKAAATAIDMHRWSYRHGTGFVLSETWRRMESEAERKLPEGDIGATFSFLESVLTSPGEALSMAVVRDLSRLIHASERVLATLPGWTGSRLRSSGTLPSALASHAIVRTIFNGEFAPWLGQSPVGPTQPVIQPRRKADLSRGFLAYHIAYARACGADTTVSWGTVTHSLDFVTVEGPIGIETNRIKGAPTVYRVREPYQDMFILQLKRWDTRPSPTQPAALPSADYEALRDDFEGWLRAGGCQNEIARQLEVNLYLAAQGLPSLQTLFERSSQ